MPRALILGGTGLVGRAIARRLLSSGWETCLTGRDLSHMPADITASGGTFVAAERSAAGELAAAFGGGADLLVDCICFTADHATALVPLARAAGSTVMISSKAVYVDAAGNHSNSAVAPRFDGPIRETEPTMAPSNADFNSREGYGANKVAAEQVLLASGAPVTVVRPSKIHGEGASPAREWFFVRRVLDRRTAVILAHRGTGADHTTAAANIAALVEVVATRPGSRILNCADPDAPNALEISRTIAALLDHRWEEVLLDGAPDGTLGSHPWPARPPIVLDLSAAAELGYVPAGDYAQTVADEVRWLTAEAGNQPPADDEFFERFFDYAAEDRHLSSRAPQAPGRA